MRIQTLSCVLLVLLPAANLHACQSTAVQQQIPAEQESPEVRWTIEELDSPGGEWSRLPNVVAGADGKLYMSWAERGAGKSSVLLFATLEQAGWSDPLPIVSASDLFLNWADFPGLAVQSDGKLLAYWLQRTGSAMGYRAQISQSTDHGKSWSEPRTLHADTSIDAEHGFVSVVPDDGRGFLAIWLDGRSIGSGEHGAGAGAMELYSRTISATGEFGPELLIDGRVCSCCQTSLATFAGGEPLVAYRDRDGAEVRDVSFSRLVAGSWTKPQTLHDDGWKIEGCPVNGPQLALTENHQFAAWFTGTGPGGGKVLALTARRGQKSFGFPISVDNGSPVGRVDIVPLENGHALVTWLEHTEGSYAEWRAQVVVDGKKLGEPMTLAEIPNDRASGFLRMAEIEGGFVAAWTYPERPSSIETLRVRLQLPR